MARYRVTATSYLNNSTVEAGAEVDYAGWPGSSLEPLDDEARRIKAFYDNWRTRGGPLPKSPADLMPPSPSPEPSAGPAVAESAKTAASPSAASAEPTAPAPRTPQRRPARGRKQTPTT